MTVTPRERFELPIHKETRSQERLDDFKGFRTWLLFKKMNRNYTTDILRYYRKYLKDYRLTTPKDLFNYLQNIDGSYHQTVIALRKYLTFLMETGEMTEQEVNPFLKVLIGDKRISVDNYIPTDEEVIKAYKQIKDERTRLFFQIFAYSGLRSTELFKMLSEFQPEKLIYNDKFAKYQLNYFRGQKKAFYVYMPIEVAKRLGRFYKINNTVAKKLRKTGLAPKYLRKWLYNFLIYNNVPESVADFIEGRSANTVGSMHYLARAKQADHWYGLVVDRLKEKLKA